MSRNTVTKTFSLPPDVATQLTHSAQEDGLPESLIVRWALERFFAAAEKAKEFAKTAERRKPRKDRS